MITVALNKFTHHPKQLMDLSGGHLAAEVFPPYNYVRMFNGGRSEATHHPGKYVRPIGFDFDDDQEIWFGTDGYCYDPQRQRLGRWAWIVDVVDAHGRPANDFELAHPYSMIMGTDTSSRTAMRAAVMRYFRVMERWHSHSYARINQYVYPSPDEIKEACVTANMRNLVHFDRPDCTTFNPFSGPTDTSSRMSASTYESLRLIATTRLLRGESIIRTSFFECKDDRDNPTVAAYFHVKQLAEDRPEETLIEVPELSQLALARASLNYRIGKGTMMRLMRGALNIHQFCTHRESGTSNEVMRLGELTLINERVWTRDIETLRLREMTPWLSSPEYPPILKGPVSMLGVQVYEDFH